jgi:hypothetical protein
MSAAPFFLVLALLTCLVGERWLTVIMVAVSIFSGLIGHSELIRDENNDSHP